MADRSQLVQSSAPTNGGTRSTAEIIRQLVDDTGRVIRSEIRVAGNEMLEGAREAGKAGGLLGAAAVCALLAAACFVVACIWALSLIMPMGAAALIMSIVLACLGGGFYAGGRSLLQRVNLVPEHVARVMKEDLG